MMDSGNYFRLNLNIKLAEELLKVPQDRRSKYTNDAVMSIISQCHAAVFLTDYEMLFDPRYDIDAVKVFYEISRRQKVVVKWCGTVSDNCLVFASPEYKDYHSFKIQDYDISCVI